MGYETNLMIGITHEKMIDSDPGKWFKLIAEIDLCKADFQDTWLNKEKDVYKDNEVFFYGTDGDTMITEDRYGSKLYSIDPLEVLKFIQENNNKKYRRYNAAIALLKSLIKGFKGENLKCVLYGHSSPSP